MAGASEKRLQLQASASERSDDPEEEEESSSVAQNDDDDEDVDEEFSTSAMENNDDKEEQAPLSQQKRKVHRLSLHRTEDFNAALRQRGVLYVARIPPRMTPTKLKTLLSDFGTAVTRVYCQEEDAAKRQRRRKLTGNAAKRYTEGWVEFADKRMAKRIALALHQQPITNHKRSVHYGDMWSVKYLPKFQWSHLTEKVAYERRVREQKLRLETATARRETAQYKQLLETGHKLDKIAERKRKRGGGKDAVDADAKNNHKKKGVFRQVQPMAEGADRATRKPLLNSLV